ncbi:hypothetical protein LJB85_03150 [Porphyromonadaceae bacterium OttesenSCG-928-L07]|nr:hypothetical protein [Porphyromonadaceae bacterium OttesenSCG-928-L07]MDL2251627.1 hypothetical protein [Odoribacter sp. OttesenSCG-928-J03]MDL2331229.1 hypothetical protein [Odoribacter sp. OttesenSCG-928-A06]
MRKIASNYIYLPGFPLIKNGYLVMDQNTVIDVVDTHGVIKEFHSLEFYGGMIVDGQLLNAKMDHLTGKDIISFLDQEYAKPNFTSKGLAIIKGADLSQLIFLKDTVVAPLFTP